MKLMILRNYFFTILALTTTLTIAVNVALVDSEVAVKIVFPNPQGSPSGSRAGNFNVPDQNTTQSAYGGELRLYDVHLAKMFEVTNYECKQTNERRWNHIIWKYYANNGNAYMGSFKISCRLAQEIASAYGLGSTEPTSILYYRASTTRDIPTLNITGSKVDKWLNFVQSFQPEF